MWKIVRFFAEDKDYEEEVKNLLNNRLPKEDLDILTVLYWIYSVLVIVAVGFIVYGAMQYALAHGDPGKAKKGKDSITYAVIGLVVVMLAAVITNFVFGVFG